MSLDEEFEKYLAAIEVAKENLLENEQSIVAAWIDKLLASKKSDEEKIIRNGYARNLANILTTEGQLLPPFTNSPPDEDLPDINGGDESKTKKGFAVVRLPCSRVKSPCRQKSGTGAIPKTKKVDRNVEIEYSGNEFEDPEEMAKILARSKGQSFAEFVVAISRHTYDFGRQMRAAMKAETTSFREYVDHVLSQRIKDLTEVLDEEQNAELQNIKRDIGKWQTELSLCKKRIREMIPDFDMDLYRKDKNYLKKVFAISSSSPALPKDDTFKKWKEETYHRLRWYSEMIYKLTKCNDQITQEISDIKSKTFDLEAREAIKQQNHIKYLNCEFAKYQKLKMERDDLNKEIAQIMTQLEENK